MVNNPFKRNKEEQEGSVQGTDSSFSDTDKESLWQRVRNRDDGTMRTRSLRGDLSYHGQVYYFESQIKRYKKKAITWTVASACTGGLSYYGFRSKLKVPVGVSAGISAFIFTYMWVSTAWKGVEQASMYNARLEELQDNRVVQTDNA